MIKYIIFDFGGVLGSNAHEWKTTFKSICTQTGLASNKIESVFEKHWPKLKIGKETMLHFWKDIAKISKKQVSPEKLQTTYNKSYSIDHKVFNLATNLKRKYELVILMNASDDEVKSKVENFELKKVFNKIYSSVELNMAKPDKEIFLYVLKDLKATPKEVLFIDNQEENVKTSRAIGINSILFKNLNQLKKELKTYLK